jgi:hypothetical protein
MMTKGTRLYALLSTALLVASSALGNLFYEESFNIADLSPTNDLALGSVNWKANYSTNGTAFPGNGGNNTYLQEPVVSASNYAIYDLRNAYDPDPSVLLWTDAASTYGEIGSIATISVSFNNSSTSADLRAVLQVNGNWYVSDETLNGQGWAVSTIQIHNASWKSLSFTSGSSLVVGAATTLPSSGTVTAVGLYDEVADSRTRIADFQVSSVFYEESFDISDLEPATDIALSNVNWQANYGTNGTAFPGNGGNGTFLQEPVISAANYAIYDLRDAYDPDPSVLVWTDHQQFYGTIGLMGRISVGLQNSSSTADLRLVMKVDGSWYISDETLNGTSFLSISSIQIPDATWKSFSFVPGSSMEIGTAATLPDGGTVTAIGLYDEVSDARVRIKEFEINSQPLYQKDFDNSTGTDAALSDLDWQANYGPDGTAFPGNGGTGTFTNEPVVSTGDYVIYSLQNTYEPDPAPVFCWTDSETSYGSIGSVGTVSMYMRNSTTNADLRVALKIDDNWYVAEQQFNSSGAGVWTYAALGIHNISWESLSFTPGSSLALGGATSLPASGTITAIGVYDDVADGAVRFAYFRIDGASNPYTAWAELFGLAGGETDDDDGDGQSNLSEYGLGGNPTNALVTGTLTFKPAGNAMELIHAQRTDDPGLLYLLETTDDLVSGTWTNTGFAVSGTHVTGGTFDVVTNTVPTTNDQLFVRLSIGME